MNVDVVAQERSVASLLDGLEWLAMGGSMPVTTVIDLSAIRELQTEAALDAEHRDGEGTGSGPASGAASAPADAADTPHDPALDIPVVDEARPSPRKDESE